MRIEIDPGVRLYFDVEGSQIPLSQLLDNQPLGTHLYVCGPAGMIDGVLLTALQAGWPKQNLHSERFLAPPAPGPSDPTVSRGSFLFGTIGCALCHTTALQTGVSGFGPALSNQTIHPYSDFALHSKGPSLADQISQGQAAGDEFRTAPLWGLGQRIFFLHDGRTSDLLGAITAHFSWGNSQFQSSEANVVIQVFNSLSDTDQQAVLNFLRSL